MLTVEGALSRILASVPAGSSERVSLADSYGRVLAEPVDAPVNLPPWANSAMDGYAIRAADLPGRLRVIETIAAGRAPTCRVEPGTAARIMTGAPVPAGADAIVKVEDTQTFGDHVVIEVAATVGQHIRTEGSDVRRGTRLLEPGKRISPGTAGLLASLGLATVRVACRPRVAILSTGDELVAPGGLLGPGQIYSSNNLALVGLVIEAGGQALDHGTVADDPVQLRARFAAAAEGADLVVTTGGVSVGDFDHVKDVIGAGVEFWRVAMKPGKPLAFGQLLNKPFFGLPGNPVSCMVNFLEFVRPVIRTMLGDPRPFLPVVDAVLSRPVKRAPGRVELVRVRLEPHEEGLVAHPAGGHQGSGNVRSMADAHGFALFDAEMSEVSGAVRVQVFDWSFNDGSQPNYPWPPMRPHEAEGCC